jgi:hypothetical protein
MMRSLFPSNCAPLLSTVSLTLQAPCDICVLFQSTWPAHPGRTIPVRRYRSRYLDLDPSVNFDGWLAPCKPCAPVLPGTVTPTPPGPPDLGSRAMMSRFWGAFVMVVGNHVNPDEPGSETLSPC